tara:strand:- start:564 stop:758 length:195 start_codon:yes stop_codon:yes gene_type:complete
VTDFVLFKVKAKLSAISEKNYAMVKGYLALTGVKRAELICFEHQFKGFLEPTGKIPTINLFCSH